ncbi:transposase [uncultured Oscillibacter sp.]
MDNMRTHHGKEVRTLLEGAGMKLRYLPAYSPDLNPIENALHVLPWFDPGIQQGEA